PELRASISALILAVCFFGLYSICFSQYRSELDVVAGTGSSTLQHVFVGLIAASAIYILYSCDPNKGDSSGVIMTRYLPMIFVASGIGAEFAFPKVMRQLIGSETNMGRQAILAILVAICGVVSLSQLWPRR